MKRKDFISSLIVGGIASALPLSAKQKPTTNDKLGYNHIPNKEIKTMDTVIHRATTRGHANHGWLDTHHTFSFANYHNPERMNFGVLRVLNDDKIAPSMGFGTHPHDNMEIISIPLKGALEHKDSMGNSGVIKSGEIQVMSAGTGIRHSEYNHLKDADAEFLQIWLFPNQKNVSPRYDQISIAEISKPNTLNQILSPKADDAGVWIHQDAWFYLGEYTEDTTVNHTINRPENGAYIFVLEGSVQIGETLLNKRDGMGIWNRSDINFVASKNTKILVMDVPMTL